MKKLLGILVFGLLPAVLYGSVTPSLLSRVNQTQMNRWVDSVFASMSADERIGQLFMVTVNPDLSAKNMSKLQTIIDEHRIGGVLFHRGDPSTQAEVTNRLQKLSRVPLFVALDGEWGLSMRLSGTTRFPKNMMLGAVGDLSLIESYGREVGRQCREMGIHLNFAPSIDVNSNVRNPVIGPRSFGESSRAVADRGIAYARGLESCGIIAVGKHFPGHGDTSDDSHYTLPVVRRPRTQLDSIELLPFRRFIHEKFSGIMTAHLYVPALDNQKDRPASLSSAIISGVLRNDYGFTGLCITDALAMKGATKQTKTGVAVEALLAGNDIALSPVSLAKEIDAVKAALTDGVLKQHDLDEKCKKILRYKYVAGLNHRRPIRIEGLAKRLNTAHADWLVARLNAEAITLLKNDAATLPLPLDASRKIAIVTLGSPTTDDFYTTAGRYRHVDHYRLPTTSKPTEAAKVWAALDEYDVILCAVHSVRSAESAALTQLAEKKTLIYIFFTPPYICKDYRTSIRAARGVVMAYESTKAAQTYAAQAIFGGIAMRGRLPVTVEGLFRAGTGLTTQKTTLGYHSPEEVGMDADRLAEIDAIVAEGLKQQAYPGCQVLVAKDGMVVYSRSFGYHDYQKNRRVAENSVYDLASSSKATGTLLAVMKAYDNKLIALDAPLGRYLPALQKSNKSDLRVDELLYHQSGMPPSINFYTMAIDRKSYTGNLYSNQHDAAHPVRYDTRTYVQNSFAFLPELVSNQPKPGYTLQVARDFYLNASFNDSIIAGIRRASLSTRGRYVYSCINFIALQKIVEAQTGRPMDQYLHREFFEPMGLRYTAYNPLRSIDSLLIVPTENDRFIRRQQLHGHVHDEAAAFQGGVSGNAGLFANANDLAKLLQLYLNDGRYGGRQLLSPETTRLFTRSKSANSRRGLGFDKPDTARPDDSPCCRLAPAAVYGHTGYTGTCFWVDPDNQLIYIFLSNRVNPSRINSKLSSLGIRGRIHEAIYRSLRKKN